MNLVLIGYRGTGKSTLSDEIGNRLGMPVFHMDGMLEERFGEKIAAFVARSGWDAFRDEESRLAEELSKFKNVVIDCGGGVVIRSKNIEHLRQQGFIVWLQADPITIAQRIGGDSNRPSLTGVKSSTEEIQEILNQRTPLYESAADWKIDTVTHSFRECVDRIEAAWRKRRETLETL